MRVKVWGARGSVPSPGPHMNRYGGNTSCVQLTLASGEELILDAGTGHPHARSRADRAGAHPHPAHPSAPRPHPGPDVLPAVLPGRVGDHDLGAGLAGGLARDARRALHLRPAFARSRCASFPARSPFATRRASQWELGGATIRAEAVTHRGPTLGYRITDGDTTIAYIPDHEPALGSSLDELEPEWISGYRPRPRRRPPDPRLPVHRRRVPRPRRLGPLRRLRRAHLRAPGRRQAHAALSSRPASRRRVPRRVSRLGAAPLAGARRRRGRDRHGHGGRRARDRRGCPDCPRLSSAAVRPAVQGNAPQVSTSG